MTPADHHVYFVLDPSYRADLWAVSRRGHVWIRDTPGNHDRIQAVWDREGGDSSPMQGVTSIPDGDATTLFYDYLQTIDDHHNEYEAPLPWTAIHVVGLTVGEVSAERIVAHFPEDLVSIEPDDDGFTIRRRID